MSSPSSTINGGATGTLTVTPNNIVAATSTPGAISDVLTITPVGGTIGSAFSYTITMTITGAHFVFANAPTAFTGAAAGSSSVQQSLTVSNNGNAPATPTVNLSAQSNTSKPFAVGTGAQTLTFSTAINQGSTNSAVLSYGPPSGDTATDTSPDTATVTLSDSTSGDVICGTLPTLQLSGSPSASGIAVTPTNIALATVTCNTSGTGTATAAAAQNVTVSIATSTSLSATSATYTATLANGTAYTITSGASGTLCPNNLVAGCTTGSATATITLTPVALAYPLNVAPNAYNDVLTITTSAANDVAHTVNISQPISGAVITATPTTGAIAFDSVYENTTASSAISITNMGNVSASIGTLIGINLSSVGSFTATPSSAVAIAPAATVNGSVVYSAPTVNSSNNPASGTVSFTAASQSLCAPLPSAISLTANATNVAVGVDPPAALTFTGPSTSTLPTPPSGSTYCNTQAAPVTFTVSNLSSNTAFNLNAATFANGSSSQYTISPLPSATNLIAVAPGASQTFTVTSTSVPTTYNFQASPLNPNYTDTLTFNTDLAGDSPHVLALNQTPYGAVLSNFLPTPPTFSFSAPAGGSQSIFMALTNNGNAPATIIFDNLSQGTAPAGTFGFTQNYVLQPDTTVSGTAAFAALFTPPAGATSYSGATATLDTSATPLCGAIPNPGTFALSGTATTGAVYTVAPTSVAFNTANSGQGTAVPCGATSGLPTQTVTFKNTSGSSITYTATVPAVNDENGLSRTFTVSPASGSIANGVTQSFTITPPPIPTPSGSNSITIGSAVYSTTLTFTINGSSSNTKTVPLTVYPFGTLLSFNPGAVTSKTKSGQTNTTSFVVRNLGNQSAGASLRFTNGSGATGMTLVQPAQSPNATAQTATTGQSVTLTIRATAKVAAPVSRRQISNVGSGTATGTASAALSLTSGAQCQSSLPTLTITPN